MNWNNFQFCCRYLNQKLSEGIDLSIAQETLIQNYSRYKPIQLLTTPIYQSILTSSHPQELLSIYGQMKLNKNNESLTKLANVKSYLFITYAVFIILSLICNVFVIPVFQEIFDSMDAPKNIPLEQFSSFWLISFSLLLLSGFMVMKFSSLITNIYKSARPFKASFLSNTLLSKALVNQILQIDALTYSPLKQDINKYSKNENEFTKRLKLDNLDISKELEALINTQYISLSKLINSQLSLLLFIVSFLVVIAIFNFVYTLYAPIFAIGTTI